MSVPLYEAKAEFFKTLGHPARIRILELLSERDHAVHELLERIASGGGTQPLPAVLVLGLPVQALIAVLVALIARLLLRVASAIAALLSRPPAWSDIAVAFVGASAEPRVSVSKAGSPQQAGGRRHRCSRRGVGDRPRRGDVDVLQGASGSLQ